MTTTVVSDRFQLKGIQGELHNVELAVPMSRVYLDTIGNSSETLETLLNGTSSKNGNYKIVNAKVAELSIPPVLAYKNGTNPLEVTFNFLYYSGTTLYKCSIKGTIADSSTTFTYSQALIASINNNGVISINSYIAQNADSLPEELVPTVTSVKGTIL